MNSVHSSRKHRLKFLNSLLLEQCSHKTSPGPSMVPTCVTKLSVIEPYLVRIASKQDVKVLRRHASKYLPFNGSLHQVQRVFCNYAKSVTPVGGDYDCQPLKYLRGAASSIRISSTNFRACHRPASYCNLRQHIVIYTYDNKSDSRSDFKHENKRSN